MSDAYDKISKMWSQFPKELENSNLYDDVNNLKTTFEKKKHFFDEYLTKIVIIGNVSTGKSALINALLGKEYFATITGNGSLAFFYCSLSEKNYEYFTVNNCQIEHKDISMLKKATKLNVNLPDFIDRNSVIKVYIKHDESGILEGKTVIVDCPGLGHDERNDKEVEKHCLSAELFIFMFDINEPATLNQSNYIKTIRKDYKNPICFFLYNKCDLPEFNDEMKITLKTDFFELFGKQYASNLQLNSDPLYFISALEPSRFDDFSRLKTDVMEYKKVNYVRYANVQSILSDELSRFHKNLDQFMLTVKKEKIVILKSIDDIKYQMKHANEKYSLFLNYVKRRIENCKFNLQVDKIFDVIFEIIDDFDGTCYRIDASQMISKIEKNIRKKVTKFIENHIKNMCIEPINQRILEINKDDPAGIVMKNNIDYNISQDLFAIPNIENIKNIFWWYEYGDKTIKVKETYSEFLKSKVIKKHIKATVKDLYKEEFTKIEKTCDELVECTRNKYQNKELLLNDTLRILDNKLEILAQYEKEVNENEKALRSSFM